ncbi:hypothetical protein HZQ90_09320 [Elizabethkingia anophelis]|nr:hypothetical protein [Elizabethkingia anophelis]
MKLKIYLIQTRCALGIKREKRSLGYSTQEVKGDDVNKNPTTNFLNNLSGQVKPFEIKSYSELKVGINGCIYLGRDKHYYSVPHQYTWSDIKVIYTRTLVKIFFKGECIATHKRDHKAGSYTLVKLHLASHSKAYRELSPSYYITKGKQALDELGEVIEKMFSTAQVPPETFYKSCEGLLHLHRTIDPILFRTACEIALRYRSYRYAFILNLIKSKCRGVEKQPIIKHPVNDHGNIRGKEQFK